MSSFPSETIRHPKVWVFLMDRSVSDSVSICTILRKSLGDATDAVSGHETKIPRFKSEVLVDGEVFLYQRLQITGSHHRRSTYEKKKHYGRSLRCRRSVSVPPPPCFTDLILRWWGFLPIESPPWKRVRDTSSSCTCKKFGLRTWSCV